MYLFMWFAKIIYIMALGFYHITETGLLKYNYSMLSKRRKKERKKNTIILKNINELLYLY